MVALLVAQLVAPMSVAAVGPATEPATPSPPAAREARAWQGWTLRADHCAIPAGQPDEAAGEVLVCSGAVAGHRGGWWMSAQEARLGPGARMTLLGQVRLYGPSPSLTLVADAAVWEQAGLELGRVTARRGVRLWWWRGDRWLGGDRASVTMDDGRVELEAVRPAPARPGTTRRDETR